MRKIVLLLFVVLMQAFSAFAQNILVTGTVSTDEGPVIGASVLVKNTVSGTTTDANGRFSLTVKRGTVLVVAYTGMIPKEVVAASSVNVQLKPDVMNLDQVVVTAIGITRAQKTLGYAATTVKEDDIRAGNSAQLMSGLMGKVAGMQVSQAGGTGSSQKIVIRGYSSLAGNQPLFIIDGIPVNNSYSGNGNTTIANSVDFGNQANDINPDEVESVTVLKGASATALYGSRAANGVVVIVTKKGRQNEAVKVVFDMSVVGSNVLRTPQTQNMFGQGWGYDYYTMYEIGDVANYYGSWCPTENGSWGPKVDGRMHEWAVGANMMGQADPLMKKFAHVKDNLRNNFYETGLETNTNVSITGGNDKTGFAVSYGNTYSDGILPTGNDYYKRNSFSVRANTVISKYAKLEYNIDYSAKSIQNVMSGQGNDGSTIYNDILQIPGDVSWQALKDYKSVYNNADNFYTPYAQNVFWILDHNKAKYDDQRVFGKAELQLQLMPGLKAIGRLGVDYTTSKETVFNDVYAAAGGSWNDGEGSNPEQGSFSQYVNRWGQLDFSGLLSADYRFGDYSFNAVGGLNVNQRDSYIIGGDFTGLIKPGWASFQNSNADVPTNSSTSQRRLVGALLQTDLGYKNYAFLTLSARNDWSSTLPKGDNSFFYWGSNLSFILTDILPEIKSNALSFAKLRLAYGQTGNDAGTYLTGVPYYSMAYVDQYSGSVAFPINNVNSYFRSVRIPSTDLKPEISTEFEVGTDLRFFNNRISLDAAYYDKITENQIISVSVAPETGNTSRTANIGKISNRGIELTLGLVPIKTRDLTWDMTITYAKNVSKVKALWGDVKEVSVYSPSSGPALVVRVGESFGVFTSPAIQKVADPASPYYGDVVVDASGFPVIDNSKRDIIGKAAPDFTMGWNNKVKYKDFALSFMLDWRYGGMMVSNTKSIMMFTGNAPETAYNERNPYIVPNSVRNVGTTNSPIYVENNIPVNIAGTSSSAGMYGYYYSNTNLSQERRDLIPKSFIKLRELNLSYTVPKRVVSSIGAAGMEVSVFGRNLLMWTPSDNTFIDPEMTNMGNDLRSEWGEFYAAPSTRTFGGALKLVF